MAEFLRDQLAAILVKERERQQKTRGQLARELDVSDVTLFGYERGRDNPTLAKVEDLAKSYGLELTIKARRVKPDTP